MASINDKVYNMIACLADQYGFDADKAIDMVHDQINKLVNHWNPWTDKSKNISFKSTVSGIGDGEEMVAAELDTIALGQNSPYDMKPIINGIPRECDVKKLDTQNDFNTGVKGRDALRPIKAYIANLLDSMNTFAKSNIFTPYEKESLVSFYNVSPDELSTTTLKKLKNACRMLCLKKQDLRSTLPLIPFTVCSQTSDMPLDLLYTNCKKLDLAFPLEFYSFIETLQVLGLMDHVYIDEPEKLVNDLDSLVGTIFADINIIIANKDKGYIILEDTSKIRFYRITRGHPRFQILF